MWKGYEDTSNGDVNINCINQCYSTCKDCEQSGNETFHNCIECDDNFMFELKISNYLNCYNQCNFYHYKDISTNKKYFTYNNTCPEKYNKLIVEERECVEDQNDNTEYTNESEINNYNSDILTNSIINAIDNEYTNDEINKSNYIIYHTEEILNLYNQTDISHIIKTDNNFFYSTQVISMNYYDKLNFEGMIENILNNIR